MKTGILFFGAVMLLLPDAVLAQKPDIKSGTIRVSKKASKAATEEPSGKVNTYWPVGRSGNGLLIVAYPEGRRGFYTFPRAELASEPGIYLSHPDYKIISFDVTCHFNGLEIREGAYGDDFSVQQKKLISVLKPGNFFFIENIKCKNPDGNIQSIGSLAIKVSGRGFMSDTRRKIPPPFLLACISGMYGRGMLRIPKTDLYEASNIYMADDSLKIVSFDMHYTLYGVEMKEHASSDQFTPKMKDIISKLKPGNEVEFKNIKYAAPDGVAKHYGDLYFTLVK